MSEHAKLVAKKRNNCGTGGSREIRRAGNIPAVIYGKNKNTLHVILEEKEITKLYRKPGFTSKILDIELDGQVIKAIPQEIQLHPTTELASHLDLVYLEDKGSKQKVDVPIIFKGKERSFGVKKGGFFNIIHRKIKLLCDVNNIPENIEIDVSNMHVGNSLKARKLTLPDGVSLDSKKDFVVASITGRGGKSSDDSNQDNNG